jgi:hypothetical protein
MDSKAKTSQPPPIPLEDGILRLMPSHMSPAP